MTSVGNVANVNLSSTIGAGDERNEVALILRFVSQQVVEVVLDAGDIVEIRRGVDQITVEQSIEGAKSVDVFALFDLITHRRRLQVDVGFLSQIDQTDLNKTGRRE